MTAATLPAAVGARSSRADAIEPLWEADLDSESPVRGGELPPDLRERFGPRLVIPLHHGRPTVVANFVSTLDGVVAFDRAGATGGREISGGFEPDRFLMGLLRATADAVLVGAGTARAGHTRAWTPARVHPASAAGFAAWRRALGLATVPTTVLVSASGDLDVDRLRGAAAESPVMIVTTTAGTRRLAAAPDAGVDVVAAADGDHVPAKALLDHLNRRGLDLVLCEGGPRLFGDLLAAGAVDELFLTVAPQVAGRGQGLERLALVEGVGFPMDLAPWARLRSVMRSGDHLFLRHQFSGTDRKGVS